MYYEHDSKPNKRDEMKELEKLKKHCIETNQSLNLCTSDKLLSLLSEVESQYNSLEQQNKEIIKKYSELSDKYNNVSDLVVELRQQNIALQARIKELEANEDKLKREWYTIGSNDNYNALKNSGKLRQ